MKLASKRGKPALTLSAITAEVPVFLQRLMRRRIRSLHAVTDGKAVSHYIQVALCDFLSEQYTFRRGNAAKGLDFPSLHLDLKITKSTKPQSSSLFKSAHEKFLGLGHHLLVVTYLKENALDRHGNLHAKLRFPEVVFITKSRTGDYSSTKKLLGVIARHKASGASDAVLAEDLNAFFEDERLLIGDQDRERLVKRVMANPPVLGYLTLSNVPQWRIKYTRAISLSKQGGSRGVYSLI